MVIFGTRPEAIKLAPVIKELEKREETTPIVCVTGQHRQMLDQVLKAFDIVPDFDLNIMHEKQTLTDITTRVLKGMEEVLIKAKPDIILVHGDTTTTFAAALAAYYRQIPIGHVEAGLRTYRKNLLKENKKDESIIVTGNTAIDALKTTIQENYQNDILEELKDYKIILLTAHRRENLGKPLENIFNAVKRTIEEHKEVVVIYPMHKNPEIRKTVEKLFDKQERIKLIEPLDVFDFHNFINRSYLVLTDSGGIQEEAPSMGKPVLVLRNTTERPEGVTAGTLKLVGTNEEKIYQATKELLENKEEYEKMSKAPNPYGDGLASKRIVDEIVKQKWERFGEF